MPYALALRYSLILNRALFRFAPCRPAAADGVLLLLGLGYFHKMTHAQAGNTLLPMLPHFLCPTEVRLFILPQTVGALGVDVKVPEACGTKDTCACARLEPEFMFV